MTWLSIIEPIGALILEPLRGYQERKTIKVTSDTKVAELNAEASVEKAKAIVELAKIGKAAEIDWDLEAQKQMEHSWKDEFLLLYWSLPFIGSFIPSVQDDIMKGWEYISKAPDWYVWLLMGMIAASFGLRWLVAPLMNWFTGKKRAS